MFEDRGQKHLNGGGHDAEFALVSAPDTPLRPHNVPYIQQGLQTPASQPDRSFPVPAFCKPLRFGRSQSGGSCIRTQLPTTSIVCQTSNISYINLSTLQKFVKLSQQNMPICFPPSVCTTSTTNKLALVHLFKISLGNLHSPTKPDQFQNLPLKFPRVKSLASHLAQ